MTSTLENYDDTAAEDPQQDLDYIPDAETTCKICYAEFLDSEDLQVHINQVHQDYASCSKNCQFCDATYTDLDDYATHIRDQHLLQLKCCRGCCKCFTDKKLAKKHEKKHYSKSNMYSCSQCDCLFTTITELGCHELLKHDNKIEGEIVKCMPYLSVLLRLNAPEMLQAEDHVFTCQSCKFTSSDLTIYLNHLKEGKCYIIVCDKCGNVFKDKRYLLRHLHRKTKCMDLVEYVSDLIVCMTCKNEVHAKHMHAHQKVCKVFFCNPCNVRFETITDLSSHQMRKHPLELNVIVCKYCPKEYVGQDALDKHVERTHQHQFVLYKYACKLCDAIFKHPKVLFTHYFSKHKDLEPYTCRICDKKFRLRKRFTIHIKLEHKGEGAIEFDENYHVIFAKDKSEKPFIPTCVIPELVPAKDLKNSDCKNRQDSRDKNNVEDTDTLDLSAIETEGGDDKAIEVTKVKSKKLIRRNRNVVTISSSSDEDEAESLLIMKKRAQRRQFQRRYQPGLKKFRKQTQNRQQFTCKKCKKYCYTYQNYHNHLKMHSKKKFVDCVKCSVSFPSKKALTDHVAKDHATSKLIETLKSVLERKQSENHNIDNDVSVDDSELAPSQKFMRTIKRVKLDKVCEPATISVVNENDSSVKKFIENFIPDVNEATNDAKIDSGVTIKQYNSPFYRKHTVKMYKFTPEPEVKEVKLRMPEKFKSENEQKVKLKIKLLQCPIKPTMFESYENTNYENAESFQDYDNYEECKNEAIPEVAQEVMLEGSEEPHPKPEMKAPQKIVIPKLPQGYPSIHIGTLTTEAPYYKIIKVKGSKTHPTIVETYEKQPTEDGTQNTESTDNTNIISLPDGSKFITANPLAHLLGNRQVDEVLEPVKNKYYKASKTDFKGLLAEALQNMDKPFKRKVDTKPKVEKTKKKCVAKSQ